MKSMKVDVEHADGVHKVILTLEWSTPDLSAVSLHDALRRVREQLCILNGNRLTGQLPTAEQMEEALFPRAPKPPPPPLPDAPYDPPHHNLKWKAW